MQLFGLRESACLRMAALNVFCAAPAPRAFHTSNPCDDESIVNHFRRGAKWLEEYCLPVCLIVQAVLLFWRLDLLPVWGDEQFTLSTSAAPLAKIGEIVRADIHPPLYYLLAHFWIHLPWSASLIVKVRALSGLWALASTVLLHKLWFRDARFILLWSLSPCLVLYGRMGRSYTMQLFLACVALYWGMSLIRDPRNRIALFSYPAAGVALLYTHYLPGLAVILSVAAFLLYRRAWIALVAPAAIMTLAYVPWFINMGAAFGRVIHSDPYSVTQNRWIEQGVRLLYLPVSFTFGETLPFWVMVGGALLAPAVAATLWRSLRKPPDWLPLVLLATGIGYIGAARWVSFAFIPARVLFALPFYLMLLAKRTWICAALVCLWMGCLYSYFHKDDFLNKGYLLPFDEIADIIQSRSAGRIALLAIDAPGIDVSPLIRSLPDFTGPKPDAGIIWVLASRGRQLEPPDARRIWQAEFIPYSALDRYMMKLLGWEKRPTHVLQLTEFATR
jgi:hypothetical protein